MLGDSRGQTRGETDDNKKDLFLTKTSFLQTVRFLNERASAVMPNTKDILLSFQFGTYNIVDVSITFFLENTKPSTAIYLSPSE